MNTIFAQSHRSVYILKLISIELVDIIANRESSDTVQQVFRITKKLIIWSKSNTRTLRHGLPLIHQQYINSVRPIISHGRT